MKHLVLPNNSGMSVDKDIKGVYSDWKSFVSLPFLH